MNDSHTGFPDLDKAIGDFMARNEVENPGAGEVNTLALDDFRDKGTAWGSCELVSEALAAFLKERGFYAVATADYVDAFYADAKDSAEIGAGDFSYPEHTAVEVYDLPGRRSTAPVVIDFTAAQYGYDEFPKVS